MRMANGVADQSRGVLVAGRELEEAVAAGEESIAGFQRDLLNAALAREAGGVVAGFEAHASPPAEITEGELEAELLASLVELEIGNVLVAGSAVADAERPDATSALADAVENLQVAQQLTATPPEGTVHGLFAGRTTAPEDFYTLLPEIVNDVVGRTASLVNSAVGGLGRIPAAHLQPVLTSVASAFPDLGGLIQAGLRAVKRAVANLARLVPESMRNHVIAWAKKWWGEHGAEQVSRAVRTSLSVDDVHRQIADWVARADTDPPPMDRLRRGTDDLCALADRHARLAKTIERIVKALSRAIGPLVALFPPAAAWIYFSGGSGLLSAAGIAIWAGRDYLDSDVPFARVEGVQIILTATFGS